MPLTLSYSGFLLIFQKAPGTQVDLGDTDIYTIDVVWSEIQFAVS